MKSYNDIKLPFLTRVEFPESLEAIGKVYFPINVAVKKYVLKENVKYLDNSAFHNYRDENITFLGYSHINYYHGFDIPASKNPEDRRRCKTEFAVVGDIATAYKKNKMQEWEKDWDALIIRLRDLIEAYEADGAHGSAERAKEYLDHLLAI